MVLFRRTVRRTEENHISHSGQSVSRPGFERDFPKGMQFANRDVRPKYSKNLEIIKQDSSHFSVTDKREKYVIHFRRLKIISFVKGT